MSGPMVRACLRRSRPKTQTRRLVKLPRWMLAKGGEFRGAFADNVHGTSPFSVPGAQYLHVPLRDDESVQRLHSPYGVPGDRLWVRESFTGDFTWPDEERVEDRWWHEQPRAFRGFKACTYLYYAADLSAYHAPTGPGLTPLRAGWDMSEETVGPIDEIRWQPSIHMPRWASRLSLEIREVRVQRVRDITEDDARAEGFESREDFFTTFYDLNERADRKENPWVWAITFKRVRT